MSSGGDRPTAEELAAVLAALRLRATRAARAAAGVAPTDDPLAAWRRRRLAALGQSPRPRSFADPRRCPHG